MATITWSVGNGVWSDQDDWRTLQTPGTGDTAELAGAGPYVSTVDVPFSVAGVLVQSAGATLDVASTLAVAGTVAVAASAELDLVGIFAAGTIDLSAGGTLAGDGGTLDGTALLGQFGTIGGAGSFLNAGTIGWSASGPGAVGIATPTFDNAATIDLAPIAQTETGYFTTGTTSSRMGPQPVMGELMWTQELVANLMLLSQNFSNTGLIEIGGGTLTLAGGTFDNSGTVSLIGAQTETVEPTATDGAITIYGVGTTMLPTQVTVGPTVDYINGGTIIAGSVLFEQAMSLNELGSIEGGVTFADGLDLGGGTYDPATLAVTGLLQDGSIGGDGTLVLQSGATVENVTIGSGVTVETTGSGPVTFIDPPSASAAITLGPVIDEVEFQNESSFDGSIVLGTGGTNDAIVVAATGGLTLGPDFSLTNAVSGVTISIDGLGILNDGTWSLANASLELDTSLSGTGSVVLNNNAVGNIESVGGTGAFTLNSNAVAYIGSLSGSGSFQLNDSAMVNIATLEDGAAPTVAFGTGTSDAVLPGTGSLGAVLSGLQAGDVVDFAAVSSVPDGFFGTVGATIDGGSLDITGESGDTASVPVTNTPTGLTFNVVGDGSGGEEVVLGSASCFAAGTRIATPGGARAVETLRPGDAVLTAEGRAAPVRWVGCMRIDLARHRAPHRVAPVRVAAGAFAPGRPARDLLLSPDHCVAVGGALVPVAALANGASIARCDGFSVVSYWHVELDRHDILLAEGLPAESYLDVGNRALFAGEAGVRALHPDFAGPAGETAQWLREAEACAPLRLRAPDARAALRARAIELGWRCSTKPAMTISADGRPVACVETADGIAARLPAGTTHVGLQSNNFVPAEHEAASGDVRRLGVAVASMRLGGRKLPPQAPGAGWHAPAPGEDWRWTGGDGKLVLPRLPRAALLELRLRPFGTYWLPPATRARRATAA